MRSWLSSPAVALVGVLASVVTLVQAVVVLARFVYRAVVDERSLIPVWAGLVAFAAVVAVAPLEWPVVVAVVSTPGSNGVLDALYPVMFVCLAAASAGWVVVAAIERVAAIGGLRPAVLPAAAGVGPLVFTAWLCMTHPGTPTWVGATAVAAAGVLAAAYGLLALARRAAGAARAAV
jgi:hypothetical protein